ncbi:peritrophic matrix protein 1-C [Reticulomyxa filosa]|uniref:Peritrophic matrix protein 1-C n=1 Tax=Reticulomyxa filosa TaxID=46433 RepID=X6PGN9_RETFI|nr:peritrophic matrix protein 1-C [Reticulomyxa filosa]|eukprot:ETO36857.1 peritrophic matrix protein 1-C [Reticulomyxa filosa]
MTDHQCFHLKLLLAYSQDPCPFTQIPTLSPTKPPTKRPTKLPTRVPTKVPTKPPTTKSPTRLPTYIPTKHPTKSPTPTRKPTRNPNNAPTPLPTIPPTNLPTTSPTRIPSRPPTALPSRSPTSLPTKLPTKLPTLLPTKAPTARPSDLPSRSPSSSTIRPTRIPTHVPSSPPTSSPVTAVTTHVSTTPSSQQNFGAKGGNNKLKSLILIGGIIAIIGILTFCVVIALAYCCFHRAKKPPKRIELEAIIGNLQVTDESTEKKKVKEGELGPAETLVEGEEGLQAGRSDEEKDGNETHEIDLLDGPLATAERVRSETDVEIANGHDEQQSDEFVDTLKDVLMVNEMLEQDLLEEVENARNTPQGE